MKKIILSYIWLMGSVLILTAQDTPQALSSKLNDLIESRLEPGGERPVHSILVYVSQPGVEFHEAVGTADGEGEPVTKHHQFKIASVTKTFTATVILQMMEEGLLGLDDTLAHYLTEYPFVKLDQLHIKDGKSYGHSITIRQLLQHRSGLADLFFDKFQVFMARWTANKQESWNPQKHFAYYYEQDLNEMPFFLPGEGFHYSDVNYFLLGLIIQQVSGTSLAQQYRSRILEPLDMDNSFMEYDETPSHPPLWADSFMGAENVSKTSNTSFDWSGGGLVSTTKDLAIFIEALMQGKLFQQSQTLDEMMRDKPTDIPVFSYGMGLQKLTLNEKIYYGHSGFWGVQMLYAPEEKRTLCFSINQVQAPFGFYQFTNELLELCDQEN